jgi:hypothetical protein
MHAIQHHLSPLPQQPHHTAYEVPGTMGHQGQATPLGQAGGLEHLELGDAAESSVHVI